MKTKNKIWIYSFTLTGVLLIFISSCTKTEDTITLPVLTTSAVTSITLTTATCGGNITSGGGSAVTARGVCWSTSPSFTIDYCLNKTTDGSDIGNFTSYLTGLIANTTYYVRAYATNTAGTGYGALVSFTASTAGPWTTKASMSVARQSMGVVVLNNKIYVIGGYNGIDLAAVEEYDPGTNTWTTKPNMPEARNPSAAVVNNKIYVIGGNNRIVEEFDPAANTWITKNSMPTERRPYVAVVNNKIYAVGGYNDITGSLSTNEEYNPSIDTWTIKTNMPTARNSAPVAAVNGNVYAIGGEYFPHTPFSIVENYNPSTDTWTTKTSMPAARRGMAAITLNNKIYVIGGQNSNYSDLATVEEYDPSTDSWVTKTSMLTARSYLELVVVNNKIYAIGGSKNSTFLTTVEEYDPLLDK
jgi:N-acetylneuraminic acid mutarotase